MQFTLIELWGHMGLFARLVVLVLALMSVSSLIVFGERLVVSLKSRAASRAFAERVGPMLARGELDGARAAAKPAGEIGYLGRVIGAGLAAYASSAPSRLPAQGHERDGVFESVSRALERQAQREVLSLKRGYGLLATVGSTAPFVGLLGTVMGIVTAFQQMAASGSGGLGTVSAGIAEALVTTAFGLLVAIPAVMAYNYLQGWVDARAIDISESSNEFLDIVAKRLDGRLAPAADEAA
ncbi:MotA/TolQ/ExbB proton channel family protein [Sorangium sp. So ce296]|uniref:Flagellar motor protein MotA n=2 Tax=Sorangium cellulosum TaxID=56 RepID=A0A150TG60_SORCE|nr:MotA/TolQ/ExbB proton channel family protein [Sorangium cellulosum]AGP32522.1 flagellar motor protein MotA [Sorangium cellulosum So0157-2]KYG03616.1 flagellar motor protein MotA [Sorangium cellulosum]